MILSVVIALIAMGPALCALMSVAWIVQQRTGNSGWVDTIWTFSFGLVGMVAALWPFSAGALPAQQWTVAVLVLARCRTAGTALHVLDFELRHRRTAARGADGAVA